MRLKCISLYKEFALLLALFLSWPVVSVTYHFKSLDHGSIWFIMRFINFPVATFALS